jgi:hypothetical protein
MKSNMKVILSAVGVVALLASPALAKSHERHHPHAAPSLANIPADAQASDAHSVVVQPYSAQTHQPVYTPENNGLNPDYQLGGEN